jgi:hypothetical protein
MSIGGRIVPVSNTLDLIVFTSSRVSVMVLRSFRVVLRISVAVEPDYEPAWRAKTYARRL